MRGGWNECMCVCMCVRGREVRESVCTPLELCGDPAVTATALISKLKTGGGSVCCRVSSVARGLPENLTKFSR